MLSLSTCLPVYALWLYWQSCIDPGGEPAQQCIDARVAIMQKEERRTGALVFVLSGTVGDDPLVFIERHLCKLSLDRA